jgi:hypothetical protein
VNVCIFILKSTLCIIDTIETGLHQHSTCSTLWYVSCHWLPFSSYFFSSFSVMSAALSLQSHWHLYLTVFDKDAVISIVFMVYILGAVEMASVSSPWLLGIDGHYYQLMFHKNMKLLAYLISWIYKRMHGAQLSKPFIWLILGKSILALKYVIPML